MNINNLTCKNDNYSPIHSSINNLTFNDLRNELANSRDNPVKESLIRNIMFIRYNQHIQKKNLKSSSPKQEQTKAKRQKPPATKKYVQELYDDRSNKSAGLATLDAFSGGDKRDDILDFIDDVNSNPATGGDNSEQVIEELYDTRDIIEYERDKANNNLMQRLNGDITIRNVKTKNKTDFLLPYSNDPGDNYASFKDIGKSPHVLKKNDFSNIKLDRNSQKNKI